MLHEKQKSFPHSRHPAVREKKQNCDGQIFFLDTQSGISYSVRKNRSEKEKNMEAARIISLPGQPDTQPVRKISEDSASGQLENVRIILTKTTRGSLEEILGQAEKKGDLRSAKRIMAIFAPADGYSFSDIASILGVHERTVCRWFGNFLLKGPGGLESRRPPGRKSKLTKSQKRELGRIVTEGPVAAGFSAACWRSPMLQALIYEKFGVFYAVNYISRLLKDMGFSWQKARFVADRQDVEARKKWLEETWPEILGAAGEKDAYILFGDESSFPQWGSLTWTWAKKGQQPVVKTSGSRKSYKVFGLIDYFTGRFFSKGHEGRLNSESYTSFLKEVMRKTRKHLILIQDGASYHKSRAMRKFFEKNSRRLTVYSLPAYSPDYNPIEKLWKKIKEKEIHLHHFPTFADLKKRVNEALLTFEDLKNEVLSLFVFYDELVVKNNDRSAVSNKTGTHIEISISF